jgi:hypothetical protein
MPVNDLSKFPNRLEILDLLNRYIWAHDRYDLQAVLDLFAPNAVRRRFSPSGEEAYRIQGVEDNRRFLAAIYAMPNKLKRSLQIYNPVFDEVDRGGAIVRAYFMNTVLLDAQPTIWTIGRYRFKLTKVSNNWRFSEYDATFEYVHPSRPRTLGSKC